MKIIYLKTKIPKKIKNFKIFFFFNKLQINNFFEKIYISLEFFSFLLF